MEGIDQKAYLSVPRGLKPSPIRVFYGTAKPCPSSKTSPAAPHAHPPPRGQPQKYSRSRASGNIVNLHLYVRDSPMFGLSQGGGGF
jgi:hypothetical protein